MNLFRRVAPVLALPALLLLASGCSDRDAAGLAPARGNTDPLVFADDFGQDVYFQAFSGTFYAAVSRDSVYAYEGYAPDGARSLKIAVPPAGSALGAYSGGVLTSAGARDLADYNALTFYARTDSGSVAAPTVLLNEVGFGNDNTGGSLYGVSRENLPLSPQWTFHIVPIPAPSKLISERGLFLFAEGLQPEYRDGYHIWFDEIRFARLGNVEPFRPIMDSVSRQYFVGSAVSISGTRTIFSIDGAFVPVNHMPAYFDYVSSDPAVAVVDGAVVRVVGTGTSTVTATLEGMDVNGRVTVTGYLPPTVAAPVPVLPAGDVISMFSGAYADVPIDTWNTGWGGSTARLEDYTVAGDLTKMYSALNYVGIEFLNALIDASAMTHFHLDVYAPAGTDFKVKLVSFPPAVTGVVETLDVVLDAASTPAFTAGGWSSLDIPLTAFTLPADWDWASVGQLVLSSSNAQLVLVDNVYWHR
ncbi:MAG: hypothetical protein IH621_12005 [Krumholzibacteria bacterium]|nr:hypothetical protein [Candidatus Krumholzibacteria bacterium]